MTHCRSEKLEPRSFWMSGSATLTTVTSSSSMNTATQTTASVTHLRRSSSGKLQCRAEGAAHVAELREHDGRWAGVVEQVGHHRLLEARAGVLAEARAHAAAEDNRLH